MTRLRYNNESGTTGSSLTLSATTFQFGVAPNFSTIVAPDYIPIALEPNSSNYEIVWLTAYTAGATTGTIKRQAENSSLWPAVGHVNGITWAAVSTTGDYSSTVLVDGFGADPNGVIDSTPAFLAAYNALGGSTAGGGGTIEFGPGIYKVGNLQPLNQNYSVVGQGMGATTLVFYGSGDCLRITNPNFGTPTTVGFDYVGNTFRDFSIEGTNASGTANGIHYGDMLCTEFRNINIRNFNQGGSVGLWFDNIYSNSERTHCYNVSLHQNTTGVKFDLNSGLYGGSLLNNNATGYTTGQVVYSRPYFYTRTSSDSGNAHAIPSGATSNTYWTYLATSYAQSSWDYAFYDFSFISLVNQSGIVLNNGATLDGVSMSIVGNFQSNNAMNSGVVLTVTGSSLGQYSRLNGYLFVNVESDLSNGGTAHQNVNFGTQPNNYINVTGYNLWGGSHFVASNNSGTGSWKFIGPVQYAPELPGLVPSISTVLTTATHTSVLGETTIVTSGTFTDTLPSPVLNGTCTVVNTGSGTITVTPPSGSLYDLSHTTGNQTYTQGQSASFQSDGTNWYRVQ